MPLNVLKISMFKNEECKSQGCYVRLVFYLSTYLPCHFPKSVTVLTMFVG